jgi:hypothetical protein
VSERKERGLFLRDLGNDAIMQYSAAVCAAEEEMNAIHWTAMDVIEA